MRPARRLGLAAMASLTLAGAGARAAENALFAPGSGPRGTRAGHGGDSPSACAALAEGERWRLGHEQITEVDVYRSMGEGYADMAMMYTAAIVPAFGLELQRGSASPGLTVSWPGSIPFGPVTACRFSRSGSYDQLRTLRLTIEPGILVRKPLGAFLRPALRAIWHRSGWPVGFGAGIGSTLLVSGADETAASVSPELLVHYGRCCAPGYLLLSVRADRYWPRRQPDAMSASVGLAYW